MSDFEIYLPPGAFTEYDAKDPLGNALRGLTRTLIEKGHGEAGGGFFGGDYGYGVDFQNDIFMMHHYCWCDEDDCEWCSGCHCPESAFHFYIDGQECTYKQYDKFYNEQVYTKATNGMVHCMEKYWKLPRDTKQSLGPAIDAASKAANERRSTSKDNICSYCTIDNALTGRLAGHSAPNFWHKPSGFRVQWYKYIGRSMEVLNPSDKPINLQDIMDECVRSLQ